MTEGDLVHPDVLHTAPTLPPLSPPVQSVHHSSGGGGGRRTRLHLEEEGARTPHDRLLDRPRAAPPSSWGAPCASAPAPPAWASPCIPTSHHSTHRDLPCSAHPCWRTRTARAAAAGGPSPPPAAGPRSRPRRIAGVTMPHTPSRNPTKCP